MMRLPRFRFLRPRTVTEAARILADDPSGTKILAGGTDLLPNMKRRTEVPGTLVSVRGLEPLRGVADGRGMRLGAAVTLTEIVRDSRVRGRYAALWQAASQVATPHLRNMGTLGGNLCLDTRCTYYDQGYEWRKAIGFCLKKDGDTCWVAPSSSRCLAVSSTDTAPALIAHGAHVRLVSERGERVIALRDLFANDGIQYSTRAADEILTEVLLGAAEASESGFRSTYWKLRRRGSFDFPVLSVAAAVRARPDGVVEEARLVLGAVASRPVDCQEAAEHLRGRPLSDASITEAAELAFPHAKPMDNTDFLLHWRKKVVREFVGYALREVRGDDLREVRRRIARQDLLPIR